MQDKPAGSGRVPAAALWLGYAGILPQAVAVALAMAGSEWRFVGFAGGYAYAALIFSFLGGVWWGQAISRPDAPRWAFVAAVLPSLIGLAFFLPWTFGWSWPDYSLVTIGILIALSPLVDRELGAADAGFMRLRWHLSLALGGLSVWLGVLAFLQV